MIVRDLKHLKDLSARAAPYLPKLGDDREQFRAVAGDNYHGWDLRPSHPLAGTIMVGEMSGYYEPEWEEETAWEALDKLVCDHFTDWETAAKTGNTPELTRPLDSAELVFAAADEMLGERKAA